MHAAPRQVLLFAVLGFFVLFAFFSFSLLVHADTDSGTVSADTTCEAGSYNCNYANGGKATDPKTGQVCMLDKPCQSSGDNASGMCIAFSTCRATQVKTASGGETSPKQPTTAQESNVVGGGSGAGTIGNPAGDEGFPSVPSATNQGSPAPTPAGSGSTPLLTNNGGVVPNQSLLQDLLSPTSLSQQTGLLQPTNTNSPELTNPVSQELLNGTVNGITPTQVPTQNVSTQVGGSSLNNDYNPPTNTFSPNTTVSTQNGSSGFWGSITSAASSVWGTIGTAVSGYFTNLGDGLNAISASENVAPTEAPTTPPDTQEAIPLPQPRPPESQINPFDQVPGNVDLTNPSGLTSDEKAALNLFGQDYLATQQGSTYDKIAQLQSQYDAGQMQLSTLKTSVDTANTNLASLVTNGQATVSTIGDKTIYTPTSPDTTTAVTEAVTAARTAGEAYNTAILQQQVLAGDIITQQINAAAIQQQQITQLQDLAPQLHNISTDTGNQLGIWGYSVPTGFTPTNPELGQSSPLAPNSDSQLLTVYAGSQQQADQIAAAYNGANMQYALNNAQIQLDQGKIDAMLNGTPTPGSSPSQQIPALQSQISTLTQENNEISANLTAVALGDTSKIDAITAAQENSSSLVKGLQNAGQDTTDWGQVQYDWKNGNYASAIAGGFANLVSAGVSSIADNAATALGSPQNPYGAAFCPTCATIQQGQAIFNTALNVAPVVGYAYGATAEGVAGANNLLNAISDANSLTPLESYRIANEGFVSSLYQSSIAESNPSGVGGFMSSLANNPFVNNSFVQRAGSVFQTAALAGQLYTTDVGVISSARIAVEVSDVAPFTSAAEARSVEFVPASGNASATFGPSLNASSVQLSYGDITFSGGSPQLAAFESTVESGTVAAPSVSAVNPSSGIASLFQNQTEGGVLATVPSISSSLGNTPISQAENVTPVTSLGVNNLQTPTIASQTTEPAVVTTVGTIAVSPTPSSNSESPSVAANAPVVAPVASNQTSPITSAPVTVPSNIPTTAPTAPTTVAASPSAGPQLLDAVSGFLANFNPISAAYGQGISNSSVTAEVPQLPQNAPLATVQQALQPVVAQANSAIAAAKQSPKDQAAAGNANNAVTNLLQAAQQVAANPNIDPTTRAALQQSIQQVQAGQSALNKASAAATANPAIWTAYFLPPTGNSPTFNALIAPMIAQGNAVGTKAVALGQQATQALNNAIAKAPPSIAVQPPKQAASFGPLGKPTSPVPSTGGETTGGPETVIVQPSIAPAAPVVQLKQINPQMVPSSVAQGPSDVAGSIDTNNLSNTQIVYYYSGNGYGNNDAAAKNFINEVHNANSNAVVVITNIGTSPGTGSAGTLATPQGAQAFDTDLNTKLANLTGIPAQTIANMPRTVVFHSGGFSPADATLQALGNKVSSVLALDGMYGNTPDILAAWKAGNPNGTLDVLCVSTCGPDATLVAALQKAGVSVNQSSPAIQQGGVTVTQSTASHNGLVAPGSTFAQNFIASVGSPNGAAIVNAAPAIPGLHTPSAGETASAANPAISIKAPTGVQNFNVDAGVPAQEIPRLASVQAWVVKTIQNFPGIASVKNFIARLSPTASTQTTLTPAQAKNLMMDYLFSHYTQDSRDFLVAKQENLTLEQYVVGGMTSNLITNAYFMGKAMDAAGLQWEITSGYRDNVRQAWVTSQVRAAVGNSQHGNTPGTCGYGCGLAIDYAGTGNTSSNALYAWIDQNGQQYGLGRPYPPGGNLVNSLVDNPHVAPTNSNEYVSHRGTPAINYQNVLAQQQAQLGSLTGLTKTYDLVAPDGTVVKSGVTLPAGGLQNHGPVSLAKNMTADPTLGTLLPSGQTYLVSNGKAYTVNASGAQQAPYGLAAYGPGALYNGLNALGVTPTTNNKGVFYVNGVQVYLKQMQPVAPNIPGNYNPASAQAVLNAMNVACKITGCNASVMGPAMVAVTAVESEGNSLAPHGNSQYQGLGQLGTRETYTAINKWSSLAQSPNLSSADQAQINSVVTAATNAVRNGQNPNTDPVLGAWLLVGNHLAIGDLPKVSAVTSDPRTAAAYLMNAQFAPVTFAGNFGPGTLFSPAAATAYNGQRAGFFYPGMSAGQANQQVQAAYAGKFNLGLALANKLIANGGLPTSVPGSSGGGGSGGSGGGGGGGGGGAGSGGGPNLLPTDFGGINSPPIDPSAQYAVVDANGKIIGLVAGSVLGGTALIISTDSNWNPDGKTQVAVSDQATDGESEVTVAVDKGGNIVTDANNNPIVYDPTTIPKGTWNPTGDTYTIDTNPPPTPTNPWKPGGAGYPYAGLSPTPIGQPTQAAQARPQQVIAQSAQQATQPFLPPPIQPITATSTSPTTPANPVVTIVASPTQIEASSSAQVSWSSIGTSACSVTDQNGNVVGTTTSGSATSIPLFETTVFTAQCQTNTGTSIIATTSVTVYTITITTGS